MAKEIIQRLQKSCSICSRKIKLILYKDRGYRGGHYFGKTPLYTKAELDKIDFNDTKKVKIHGLTFNVLKKDPKPYSYAEYWECPKCYWRY
jgi:hypothetical protein